MRKLNETEARLTGRNLEERAKQRKKQEIEIRITELQLRELEIEYQKRKILAEAIDFWYEDKKKQIIESLNLARQDHTMNEKVIGISKDQIINGV